MDNKDYTLLFEGIYRDYFNYVTKVLAAYPTCKGIHEDLAQEVFTAIWKKKKQLNSPKEIKKLLSTIAHNKASDYARKIKGRGKKKYLEIFNLSATFQYKTKDPNPLEIAILNEKETALKKLLKQCRKTIEGLSRERERTCLEYHIDGKTNNEISSALGISLGSVNTHICLARKKLREQFATRINQIYQD